jgi:acyl dehydratase
MDELRRFCIRMLGDGPAAVSAAEAAAAAAEDGDRLATLQAAVLECHRVTNTEPGAAAEVAVTEGRPQPAARGGTGLATAVARELAAATARLSAPEREVLALRDLLGLSYEEIAAVTGTEPDTVGPLLAGARLRLRQELRGSGTPSPECPERDRALRTIAARQDDEPVAAADAEWLVEHLGHCRGCAQVHAAMLEATACYRGWGAAEGAGALSGAGT